MERIQFYPKGEDPKGKNYIFFAAHPADKERYLDELRSEILLAEGNCVFWLDTQPERPWDDMVETDLARMQMFLFPVTKALLGEENPAISQWLPFALEHNIPVLPILVESGLEERYAQVFGDRQYIDKVMADPTAIPYSQKLKRLLQDTLISKELAEKVRQAFDAYIFLSYRKKDRALAAKLMKLIHQIPQMRDVAIWYDEFLVPGEDFNDNIGLALNKSDLFAMAVTPNLVGEDNYVLSTEYPEAIKAEKPVMAAQVADTDSQLYHRRLLEAAAQISRSTEVIPHTIDAYNADALRTALLGNLKHIALAQNDDPMHNYLIGLAYLNGVDVEVDREKALELITDSAEKNCLEAMVEIINMYHNGNGVERNIPEAIKWHHKLIEWRKQHIDSQEDAIENIVIHRNLGVQYNAIRQFEEEKAAYLATLAEIDHMQDRLPAQEILYQRLSTYDRLVDVCLKLSHPCEDFIAKGIQIANELADKTGDMNAKTYISSFLSSKSKLYEEKDYEESIRFTKQSLQFCSEYAQAKGNFDAERRLTGVMANLGRLLRISEDKAQLAEAEYYLNEAVTRKRELVNKTDLDQDWEQLAASCNALGSFYNDNGDSHRAETAYRESMEIYEKLYRESGLLSYSSNYQICCHNIAILCREIGRVGEAERLLLKVAKQIKDHQAEIVSAPDLRSNATTYKELGLLYKRQMQWEKAEPWMKKAERLLRSIANTDHSAQANLELGEHLNFMGLLYIDWHQRAVATNAAMQIGNDAALAKGEVHLKEAMERLCAISPEYRTNRVDAALMQCYRLLSDLYKIRPNLPLSSLYARKAVELADKITDQSIQVRRERAKAYTRYGCSCDEMTGEVYYLKACSILENLSKRTKSCDDFYAWAVSLYYIGVRSDKKVYLRQAKEVLSHCDPSYEQQRLYQNIKEALK